MQETEKSDTSHYSKCKTHMLKYKKNDKIRVFFSACLTVGQAFLNIQVPLFAPQPNPMFRFMWGMLSLFCCIGIALLMLLSNAKTPKILMFNFVWIISGMILRFIHPAVGMILLFMCMTIIPECKKMRWIQQQSGYPHFSERLDKQMESFGKEYQSDYHFDGVKHAEMSDIPEGNFSDFTIAPKKEKPEMPDISDI